MIDWRYYDLLFAKARDLPTPYRFGGKVATNDLGKSVASVCAAGLDCSGWQQYALYRASHSRLLLPEGTAWDQAQLLKDRGFRQLAAYRDVAYAKADPSRWFACFLEPRGGEPGHIWLVNAGTTRECHGHVGVGGRNWNAPPLLGCDLALEVTDL